MSALEGIGVRIEPPLQAPIEAGNALPVLHEIRHALYRLQRTGEGTVIDLSAIPFGPGDRDRLLEELGTGEVQATVDALGPTHIRETALPGVWMVEYRSPGNDEVALHIEVTTLPGLLATPIEEVGESLQRLTQRLAPSDPARGGKEE